MKKITFLLTIFLTLLIISCTIHKARPQKLNKILNDYPGRFTQTELNEIRKYGGRYQTVSELAECRDLDGDYIFSGFQIAKLCYKEIDSGRIRKLLSIRSDLKFSGTEITQILLKEKSIRKLKKMLKLKYKKDYIFNEKSFTECIGKGYNYKQIKPLVKSLGKLKLQPNIYIIMRILKTGTSDINSFRKIDNFNFTSEEFVRFLESGGNAGYARILFNQGFSGRSIYRFKQLNLTVDDVLSFVDSDLPNAVILISEYDYNDEFESDASINLFKEICSSYDCYTRIVSNEDEVYTILNQFKDIDLLWLAGHGVRSGIILSEKADMIEMPDYENYILDIEDYELSDIKNLRSVNTVFLDACETGKGKSSSVNFAGFIKKILPEANVIFSDRIFSHDEIILDKIYPLRIRFREKTNQDTD